MREREEGREQEREREGGQGERQSKREGGREKELRVHTSPVGPALSCRLTSLSLITSDVELIKEQSWLSVPIRLATETRQRG